MKGFYEGPEGPGGYNAFCSLRGWRRLGRRGRAFHHAYFLLRRGTGEHAGSVFFDYAASERNPRLYPARLFRDFLVRPDPTAPDVLLGKAYLDLGRLVPLGYFVLERDRRAEGRP